MEQILWEGERDFYNPGVTFKRPEGIINLTLPYCSYLLWFLIEKVLFLPSGLCGKNSSSSGMCLPFTVTGMRDACRLMPPRGAKWTLKPRPSLLADLVIPRSDGASPGATVGSPSRGISKEIPRVEELLEKKH